MSNQLSDIRQQCADELDALEYFSDVAVLVEDRGDLENEVFKALGILEAVAGKVGAFVLFTTESANISSNSEFGPLFGECRHAIQFVEVPEINRGAQGTNKTAWDLACAAASALILFKPASANAPIVMREPTLEPILFELPNRKNAKEKTLLPGWQLNFQCSGALTVVKTQAAAPVISVDEDENIVMSTTTPGAAVFYTLDGKKPATVHSVYTAPIEDIESGTLIKARTWLSGFLASSITQFTKP